MGKGNEPHRHPMPVGDLRAGLEVGALRGLMGALRGLPREPVRKLSGAIAGTVGMRLRRLHRVGMENLQAAFPERDRVWCEQTLAACFRQLGYMAAELAHFDRLTPQNIGETVQFESSDAETFFRERAAAGGAIIATGHFGNWELFAQAAGLMGSPIHIVHRPLKNPRVDDLLTGIRARAGTEVVYKHAAARQILQALRRGALVAVPIDQHAPGATGIPVPFFGRLAQTTAGPARLAQIARVPIQTAVLARVGDSDRHQIVACPPLDPPPRGKDPAVLLSVTQQLNLQFEDIVRRYPEQWLWMHRRWRTSA